MGSPKHDAPPAGEDGLVDPGVAPSGLPIPGGEDLPRVSGTVPGPRSKALAARLARVESPNITLVSDNGPVFWASGRGANLVDVDGNVYVDLAAGFAAAATGQANERVSAAVSSQAGRLTNALGDLHPAAVKVALLERLAQLAPGDLGVTILASAGAEAVEAALKTAVLATGRPGVLAFTGSYHGLTYGALACTWRDEFRGPFQAQLFGGVRFAPYPDPYRWAGSGDVVSASLAAARRLLEEADASATPIGCVIVEPIQGRGGMVEPPAGFLPALRSLCDQRGLILVLDEIYCGLGRTGRWFACEHEGVVPDILLVGKALSGLLPLSAAIGRPGVMSAWPPSTGEAIHTSTFLGNPLACAAALAQLQEIDRGQLVARAASLGGHLRRRLDAWRERYPAVGDVRGRGLMQGVDLVRPGTREPDTTLALRVADAALRRGVLLVTEGPALNVLAFTPPLVITREQLDSATDIVEEELGRDL